MSVASRSEWRRDRADIRCAIGSLRLLWRKVLRRGGFEGQIALEEALRVARQQHARAYELRAATSLAKLRGEQRRRAEAQDLLAPVYAWFTEGFDTADLKEGKALLDGLC
jgi:predicted ATPase